ncbi:MAG: M48 family metalloprotease [Desulfobaccales bacterium]
MIVNNKRTVAADEISLDEIFDYSEIHSEYLRRIIKQVLSIISRSIDLYEDGFGPIHERKTFTCEAGEVTENGDINLDSQMLRKYDDDVAMAIISHELAHHHLKHYLYPADGLKQEYEADELARKWGFNIDKFREVCGPPTIQEQPIRR